MRRRRLEDDVYSGSPTITGPLFAQESIFDRSPVQPDQEELLVGALIAKHHGREHPISIARLREATGFSERQVKAIVEQLVVRHHIRIGGRREEPAGYFLIETAADLDAAVRPYRNQILAMFNRLRVLEEPRALREFLGQLRLD